MIRLKSSEPLTQSEKSRISQVFTSCGHESAVFKETGILRLSDAVPGNGVHMVILYHYYTHTLHISQYKATYSAINSSYVSHYAHLKFAERFIRRNSSPPKLLSYGRGLLAGLIKIIYIPWQKKSYEKRLEIRYDGTSVTLLDENGNIIQDHIDLTEKP